MAQVARVARVARVAQVAQVAPGKLELELCGTIPPRRLAKTRENMAEYEPVHSAPFHKDVG